MKIILAGGTGYLGQKLQAYLEKEGFTVLVLSRSAGRGPNNVKTKSKSATNRIPWDGKTIGPWAKELENAHALINMAGRTVDCRYNQKNKDAILNSRIWSTKVLGEAVEACENPPKFWFNSSTATIYEHTEGDRPANTEEDGVLGKGFSPGVAKAWEEQFFSHNTPKTKQIALRSAIVLGMTGGAFPVMVKLAGLGLCSPQGDGKQWISWVHEQDFCRAFTFLMQQPLEGIVNLCAPNPIRNKDFNQLLKKKTKPFFTLPQPKWLLELGAFFIRTETELILKSRKVYPKRLLDAGFKLNFIDCEQAIGDLI